MKLDRRDDRREVMRIANLLKAALERLDAINAPVAAIYVESAIISLEEILDVKEAD